MLPRSRAGRAEYRSPSWTTPPTVNVELGTAHRGGVDIGSVQGDAGHQRRQRGAYSSRAAAKVTQQSPAARRQSSGRSAQEGSSFADKEFRAAAGNKDARSTLIRRPQNSAQPRICSSGKPSTRRCTAPSSSSGVKVRQRGVRFVLGEDTACGAKLGDDRGTGKRWMRERHGSVLRLKDGRSAHRRLAPAVRTAAGRENPDWHCA